MGRSGKKQKRRMQNAIKYNDALVSEHIVQISNFFLSLKIRRKIKWLVDCKTIISHCVMCFLKCVSSVVFVLKHIIIKGPDEISSGICQPVQSCPGKMNSKWKRLWQGHAS